jgi:hypothetical protein
VITTAADPAVGGPDAPKQQHRPRIPQPSNQKLNKTKKKTTKKTP